MPSTLCHMLNAAHSMERSIFLNNLVHLFFEKRERWYSLQILLLLRHRWLYWAYTNIICEKLTITNNIDIYPVLLDWQKQLSVLIICSFDLKQYRHLAFRSFDFFMETLFVLIIVWLWYIGSAFADVRKLDYNIPI